jgi:3-dehydroquinate dehydratase/shikimate dehydrogenase
VDLIAQQNDEWHGFLLRDRAVVNALNAVLKTRHGADNSIQGRTFLIAGVTRLSQAVGQRILKHGGILIVTDRNRGAATLLAHDLQCRVIQFEALYTTLHDVLIHAGDEPQADAHPAGRDNAIHAGYLKPGMCVVDLTAPLQLSELLRQATRRGCLIVPPTEVLLEQVQQQAKLITSKEPARQVLEQTLAEVFQEEFEEE